MALDDNTPHQRAARNGRNKRSFWTEESVVYRDGRAAEDAGEAPGRRDAGAEQAPAPSAQARRVRRAPEPDGAAAEARSAARGGFYASDSEAAARRRAARARAAHRRAQASIPPSDADVQAAPRSQEGEEEAVRRARRRRPRPEHEPVAAPQTPGRRAGAAADDVAPQAKGDARRPAAAERPAAPQRAREVREEASGHESEVQEARVRRPRVPRQADVEVGGSRPVQDLDEPGVEAAPAATDAPGVVAPREEAAVQESMQAVAPREEVAAREHVQATASREDAAVPVSGRAEAVDRPVPKAVRVVPERGDVRGARGADGDGRPAEARATRTEGRPGRSAGTRPRRQEPGREQAARRESAASAPSRPAQQAAKAQPAPRTWRKAKQMTTSRGTTVVFDRPSQHRGFPWFWVFYAILAVTIVCIGGVVMVYTASSLVKYEDSQPQVYIDHIVEDLKAGGGRAAKRRKECLHASELSPYESEELLEERFAQGVSQEDYRVEEAGRVFDAAAPAYTIYVGDDPFMTVRLAVDSTYVRLGLFTITDWKVSHVLLHTDGMPEDAADNVDTGLTYTVAVPDSATVRVNGRELTGDDANDETAVMAGFEYAAQFVDPPEAVTYVLSGLLTEPEVDIVDFEGNAISMDREGYGYVAANLFVPNREASQLPVDVLNVAETWSKLMTADLGGASYGIDQVTAFLIPGSELYTQATSFVNSIDITFVATHVLNGFTEESVTNCIMYNDKLFSCDVHFVKNMTLSASGVQRADEFSNSMIFAYIDNNPDVVPGWYLVNMQALTNEV